MLAVLRPHMFACVLQMAGGLTVCWCTSVLASLHPSVLSVPQQFHPLLFHSFLLFLLLNPFSIFHTQSRRWLIVTMVRHGKDRTWFFFFFMLVCVLVVGIIKWLSLQVTLTSPEQKGTQTVTRTVPFQEVLICTL